MAISLKKQKAVKQVNRVGAAEVDQYRAEKLHGWAAVKAFFKSKKTRSFPVGHYQNRASCRTLLADSVSDAGAVLSIA